jgi:hypothetical protein
VHDGPCAMPNIPPKVRRLIAGAALLVLIVVAIVSASHSGTRSQDEPVGFQPASRVDDLGSGHSDKAAASLRPPALRNTDTDRSARRETAAASVDAIHPKHEEQRSRNEQTTDRSPNLAASRKGFHRDHAEKSPPGWVSTRQRVEDGEALPCTGISEPINFAVYSAGPSVAGLPLSGAERVCGTSAPAQEAPANYMDYMYGTCTPSPGQSGCQPPLEVQTWPACQRALADYSFDGEPEPYVRLPNQGGAEVVEIQFISGPRIEVYSGDSTVVLFSTERALALTAVEQLTRQDSAAPPSTKPGQLAAAPEQNLSAPIDGATEGSLPCEP